MLEMVLREIFDALYRGVSRGIGAAIWWLLAGCRPRFREMYANDAYEFRHGVTGLIVEAGVLMGIIIWQFS